MIKFNPALGRCVCGTLLLLTFLLLISSVSAARGLDCSQDNCTGLIGLWHLDEISGNVVDSSGNGNTGTVTGATYGVSGKSGAAMSFDGSTSKIYRGESAWRSGDESGTITAWIKRNSIGSDHTIFSSSRETDAVNYFTFYVESTNNLRMAATSGGGGNGVIGNTTISANQWYHVAVTSNSTNWTLYVNGKEESLTTSVANSGKWFADITLRNHFVIGMMKITSEVNVFNGTIDEVSIYNRSLPASEISAIYNIGVTPVSNTTSFSTSFGSTNFNNVADISAIPNMKLATARGSIIWNGIVNALNLDFDSHVIIQPSFVSVNSSALDSSLNASANVSVDVNSCDDWSIYYSPAPVTSFAELKQNGEIVGNGSGLSGSCTSYCSNPVCSAGVLTYTVSGFSSTGGEGSTVNKGGSVSGANVTKGISGRLTKPSASSDAAQAGNTTELNLSSATSTVKWQGYFGEVTATLSLGIGSDQLFSFGSAANNQIKSVLASPDSGFDFSSLQAASVSDVDSAWGFAATDTDSATLTLNGNSTIAQVSSVSTVNLNAYSSSGIANSSIYKSGVLADKSSPTTILDFVFGVSADSDERDFRNVSVVDYELIVPVNTSGVAGTQTYYFFLDVE